MTRLEYGAISHNSGDNRNPMDRDSGGLNIMKHALEGSPLLSTRAYGALPEGVLLLSRRRDSRHLDHFRQVADALEYLVERAGKV